MGKASSAKKVARAARAGGGRRSGQRRALGFPVAIGAVIVLGLLLVVFARTERNANARPRVNTGSAGVSGDHWHVPYSVYTCVTDPSTPASTTTTTTTTIAPAATGDSTTTTAPTTTTVPTATTVAAKGNAPGEYLEHPNDAFADALGIHTHGDGVMHIHPFAESVSGRRATLEKFLDQVGARISDDTLMWPGADGSQLTFKEGETKCQGGRDAILQVARWDTAQAASNGDKPNEIITSNFGSIRLRNGQALTIAFLPEGSTIPIENDVAKRLEELTDVAPGTTTTNPQSQSSGATDSSTDVASTGSESTSPGSSSSSSSP